MFIAFVHLSDNLCGSWFIFTESDKIKLKDKRLFTQTNVAVSWYCNKSLNEGEADDDEEQEKCSMLQKVKIQRQKVNEKVCLYVCVCVCEWNKGRYIVYSCVWKWIAPYVLIICVFCDKKKNVCCVEIKVDKKSKTFKL